MGQKFDPKTGEVFTVETSDAYRRPLAIKTNWTANPIDGETNRGVSETIPDQGMSVRELFRRHVRGLPIQGEKVPLYDDDDEGTPDFRRMDLAEKQEWMEDAREELREINKRKKKPNIDPKVLEKPPTEAQSKPDAQEGTIP